MKSHNQSYSTSELLKDEFFIRWVFNPDDDSNHYWAGMMEKDPELRKKINEAREILNLMSYEKKHRLDDDDYTDMLEILVRENRFTKYERPRKVAGFSYLGIAASIVLVAAIGLSLFFLNANANEEMLGANEMEVKQTNAGEKLTVKLPDGTIVKLNSITRLSYSSSFSGDTREIYLEGEAYFDVSKDPDRPFVIHTGDITTTVLGTEFNVRSYKEEENIEVAVVEGKVKVGNENASYVYLTPNEISTYQKDNRELKKEIRDVSNVIAWYKNILVFESADSQQVWKQLENWYGVEITIENEKNIEGRYSGTYENESLETVLRGISFASGFDFEIDEKKNVVIK